jgi:hypothetical protein
MMFCFLYKWMISATLDTGKELPGIVKRHLDGCGSCRRFARIGGGLKQRLNHDGKALLDSLAASGAGQFRDQRIIAALKKNDSSEPSTPRRRAYRLRPVFAAAAALLVFVIAAIWQSMPPTQSPTPAPVSQINEEPVLAELKKIQQLAVQVESPLNREIDSLKHAVVSTANFFKSYLDMEIAA